MSVITKDLGAATAYGYAVEKGYTGTEEEFAELMASYATVGQTAVDAKDAAVAAKTAAQTAATTATNKASEANTAAQTATTKAGEAQTSAQTASSKASEASQSASQASGYAQTAETAKTDAQTAKTQAETARDNAVTAKTAAETAQGKAETAQGAAEDAAQSVSASAAQIATNTADITDLKEDLNAIEDVVYAGGGTTEIDWASYGSERYPLCWRAGQFNPNTGVDQGSTQLMRTYKTLNFDGYEKLTVKPLSGRYIIITEYSSSTVGSATYVRGTTFAVDEIAEIDITQGHYYGISQGYWSGNDAVNDITAENIALMIATLIKTGFFIVQEEGDNENKVMSQKAVSELLANKIGDTDILKQSNISKKDTGVVASGITLATGEERSIDVKTFVRKNARLAFSGAIANFTSLEVGYINRIWSNRGDYADRTKILIDATNIYVYQLTASSATLTNTIPHGLTISDYLQILVECDDTNKAVISVCCNGEVFHSEAIQFEVTNWYYPYVKATNCSISDGSLSWTCTDLNKKVWIFGDSFTRYVNTRWTYYLHESGYDANCLINGHGGAKSIYEGYMSLEALVAIGTPKYLFWCFGMNDNSDSESAPSDNWVTGRDRMLAICTDNGITPIFATIPTVNNGTNVISHEQKNAWIRSSGYRYVDFAKAVGADANGQWRTGLRESATGLHPSALGAKVLFAQVLSDFPEIMVSA